MDEWITGACADRASSGGPVPIDWRSVDPSVLADGSPVRAALEDGEYRVAEYLVSRFGGSRLYVPSEQTHRREIFEAVARRAVERGASAREVGRRFGVPRGRL